MSPPFVRQADGPSDVTGAQRLRYRVFGAEMGGGGATVDDGRGLETDRFDARAVHLVAVDPARRPPDHVVAACRLVADGPGGVASDAEFDLSPLRATGRPLIELGRTCLDPGVRGGDLMWRLWAEIARRLQDAQGAILFGTASLLGHEGHDPTLALLGARHLAPHAPQARPPSLAFPRPQGHDLAAAARSLPPLLRTYLRMGGRVGQGAHLDRDLGTTDVLVVLPVEDMPSAQLRLLAKVAG
ncbi:MAG: GNAT family N-acetyltransferase [Paracoccaceae bacterium]